MTGRMTSQATDKPIRVLISKPGLDGHDVGAKVAFALHEDGQIVVSRADTEHEDPAIGAWCPLLPTTFGAPAAPSGEDTSSGGDTPSGGGTADGHDRD